ncbi:MAG: aminotransferase class I/II-fold pyridoxal phosphate-dependent enzyme [Neisseriaceae bacterium]
MQTWNNWFIDKYNSLGTLKLRIARDKYDPRYFVHQNINYLNFVSNDYLGIAKHETLVEALKLGVEQQGVGSTGAPNLSGLSIEHNTLANLLASWLGYQACLLFNTGFQLNSSIFSQITDAETIVWFDRRCHASHIDGMKLAQVKFYSFSDDTLNSVFKRIMSIPDKRHIILTEGSFSMDGTCLYLEKLLKFKSDNQDNVLLMVDDAHGIGALGTNGHGTLEQLGLPLSSIDILIGTLGKAVATFGGFVCSNQHIINYLEQTARGVIFSTNMPPAIASSSSASLKLISSDIGATLRQRLKQNISYFLELCLKYNLPIYNPDVNISPIQLLIFNDEDTTTRIFNELRNKFIFVGKVSYPIVKRNAPRIRISLTAAHTKTDIETLCEALANAIN